MTQPVEPNPPGAQAATAALLGRGKLRVAVNRANPVLFTADPITDAPGGVAVDLARELASRLGAKLELAVLGSARECVQAVQDETAALGFFAIDPLRADSLHFTPPYVLMEGVYVVAGDSPITQIGQVDSPGRRVAVGAGSAYALHLGRALKHAQLVQMPASADVVPALRAQGLDVAAGVRQQMLADMARVPGLRMLDGRFMAIEQSMATARRHGPAACGYLDGFIEDVKRSGLVAAALARHGIEGAAVA